MFGDVLKNLERSRDLLFQSANVAHFQEAQEARILFSKEFRDRLEREKQEKRLALIDWLSPSDNPNYSVHDQHVELQGRRRQFPLTTQWLFNMGVMRGWMRKSDVSSPIFWLSGIPGAGRLVLSHP